MDLTDKLLRRIKKLLLQSEGERELGNSQAAEQFAEKAQELLTKYKLDISLLDGLPEDAANPLVYELITPITWGENLKDLRVEYTEDLGATIAEAFYCRMLAVNENNCLIIVGRKSDIEVAKIVLARVMREALSGCERELGLLVLRLSDLPGGFTSWKKSGGNEEFRFSFFCGFNRRVKERLRRKREIMENENKSTALVLKKSDKEVEDFVKTLNPNIDEPLPERAVIMETAYFRGMDYAERARLFPGELDHEKEKLLGE